MIRQGSILIAVLLLGACTTPASGLKKGDTPPVNPGELYKMQAEQAPDEIRLGVHAEGLSDHQRAALADYARGYIEAGGQQVVIRTPVGGGEAAARMAEGAEAALEAAGLSGHEIVLDVYAADQPGAPIRLIYQRWRAKPIVCGQSWNNLASTRDNQVQSNFGCALTSTGREPWTLPTRVAGRPCSTSTARARSPQGGQTPTCTSASPRRSSSRRESGTRDRPDERRTKIGG
jgi:pilus biogenesis lipoprotein CpaD